MSDFDAVAAEFERHRALPPEVRAAIRSGLWAAVGGRAGGPLLEVGAGTGRIGAAFVAAGDPYVGMDRSPAMLALFATRVAGVHPQLVLADGARLPFPPAAFGVVLLAQVVRGTPGWRAVLEEAWRVTRPGGAIILSEGVGPAEGIDARMRAQLGHILAELGVAGPGGGRGASGPAAWLRAHGATHRQHVAATWTAERTAQGFLDRHRTGARFAALPVVVQQTALQRLAAWAGQAFGALEEAHAEPYRYLLEVFSKP